MILIERNYLKKLFEVYSNSLPMVVKGKDGCAICSYSDEVEEIAEKIREEIRLRDNQIFNSFRD